MAPGENARSHVIFLSARMVCTQTFAAAGTSVTEPAGAPDL